MSEGLETSHNFLLPVQIYGNSVFCFDFFLIQYFCLEIPKLGLAANQSKLWFFSLSNLSLLFIISALQENDGLRSAGLLPAQHTVHQHVSQHQV